MKNNITLTSIKPAFKTVAIFGDDKGGVTKTASCANIADGLRQFGYNIQLVDGDSTNTTLSELEPKAVQINGRDESALDQLFVNVASEEHDLVMLDMPGSSGDSLSRYFQSRGFETFLEMGVRIVVAMVLTETIDSAKGAISWIEAFIDKAGFLLVANHRDTPEGKPFEIEKITAGEILLEIAENRIIHIPKFSPYMLTQYNNIKGVPSDYLIGGRVAEKLKLSALHSSPWSTHLKRIVRNIEPHLEWLTGRKPTETPKYLLEEKAATVSETSKFQSFKTKVEEKTRENAK